MVLNGFHTLGIHLMRTLGILLLNEILLIFFKLILQGALYKKIESTNLIDLFQINSENLM